MFALFQQHDSRYLTRRWQELLILDRRTCRRWSVERRGRKLWFKGPTLCGWAGHVCARGFKETNLCLKWSNLWCVYLERWCLFNHKLILGRGVEACPLCECWEAFKLRLTPTSGEFCFCPACYKDWRVEKEITSSWFYWRMEREVSVLSQLVKMTNLTATATLHWLNLLLLKSESEAWNGRWRDAASPECVMNVNLVSAESWKCHHWCLRRNWSRARKCRQPGKKTDSSRRRERENIKMTRN